MPLVTESTMTSPIARDSILLPTVAKALWIWDTLRLDLGEVALVTDDDDLGPLVALAATWYGPSSVLFLTDRAGLAMPGVTTVPAISGGAETKALATRLSDRPGTAAIELSGRSDVVDVLLEAMPRFSRLMLAGTAREPLTIDYYVNVHRKGLRLVSAAFDDPSTSLTEQLGARQERAARLLARPARLEACVEALSGGVGRR
jgi:hypothetical protein